MLQHADKTVRQVRVRTRCQQMELIVWYRSDRAKPSTYWDLAKTWNKANTLRCEISLFLCFGRCRWWYEKALSLYHDRFHKFFVDFIALMLLMLQPMLSFVVFVIIGDFRKIYCIFQVLEEIQMEICRFVSLSMYVRH